MSRQLRLLLWKDYLIRKRNLVTLGGVLWATAVMLSLYIVRINISNEHFPTCQFPARALPSAGMLPYLQSFLCTVNNKCSPLDQYQDIPTYENSTLTKLQRKFGPLLNNETVLEVAATVPHALKLLSKMADIADEPTFLDIAKNGLKVGQLFRNPSRVRRFLSSRLGLDDDVTADLMTSDIGFQGLLKGKLDRCRVDSMSEVLLLEKTEHLESIVKQVCASPDKELQAMMMDLLLDVDFERYIRMLGNMYSKLTGDDQLTYLGETITAVLRMTRIQSFIPAEIKSILGTDDEFSYYDLGLINKFLDLFEPTFNNTNFYKSIRDVSDTVVTGFQYLEQFFGKTASSSSQNGSEGRQENRAKLTMDALETIDEKRFDVFNILSQLTNFIFKWLPVPLKHDVSFYSTLLTKLIEGATRVVKVNMDIEERTYNVTLRHPRAVQVLVNLPSDVVERGFEALVDAQRTQIMTSKIATPEQMFCDVSRVQGFLKVTNKAAESLKKQLCSEEWKSYVTDLVGSFGIREVKDNINAIASLVIQETLGKDISNQLYTVDYQFHVLRQFIQTLGSMGPERQVDWAALFNASGFMAVLKSKAHLGKQILITIHGALAKEVVNQNPILSFKISPGLIDATTLVTAINEQLAEAEAGLAERAQTAYPLILTTVVGTLLNEEKTYKSLSTPSEEIVCNGVSSASLYLDLPDHGDQEVLVGTLCDVTRAIERGLEKNSTVGTALATISNASHAFQEVEWTTLITGLKDLYVTLDKEYPYLFQYTSYGMGENERRILERQVAEAKRFWFGKLSRSFHLGIKVALRSLDLLDRELFELSSGVWLKARHSAAGVAGPALVFHEFVKTVADLQIDNRFVIAISRNESVSSDLPQPTVAALRDILPNLPQLVMDATDIVIHGVADISPIISTLNADVPWPCTSLADHLALSANSKRALVAMETVMCLSEDAEDEWRLYIKERNIALFSFKNVNTTTFKTHAFLRISAAFDALIEDGSYIDQIVTDVRNDDRNVTWTTAWGKIVGVFDRSDRGVVFRDLFTTLDTVLSAMNTSSPVAPLQSLWFDYLYCNKRAEHRTRDCGGRPTWKHTAQFLAATLESVVTDLITYFTEANEPDSNLLKLAGFTNNTPVYEMYDKLPDFMGVLLNSYWDYGFMTQVRRAALSQFWDCEAVVTALVPPAGSVIDPGTLSRVQPYVCPSFLFWISLPRGANIFLDVVAKPQYLFYTLNVQNLSSSFERAYNKYIDLSNLLTDLAITSKAIVTADDIKYNTLEGKLEKLVDKVLNYRINESDLSYQLFAEINQKQFASMIYLTRVVGVVNKLATEIENLTMDLDNGEEKKKIVEDLETMKKIFKRRPTDVLALHFDLITDVVITNNANYTLINALEATCDDSKNNMTGKDILVDNQRVKNQICAKSFKQIFGAIDVDLTNDLRKARDSLMGLVMTLQNGEEDEVFDIVAYLKERKSQISALRDSIKHAYDLGIPHYLQYLMSNLRHYDVILTFLSGGDWWKELRELYTGPVTAQFLDYVENSFEITSDVLTNLDKIHLVRLLRDINVNNSDAFCMENITLSDYVPDDTGALSWLKQQLCARDNSELIKEVPPLLFASIVFDRSLEPPKTINYTNLDLTVTNTESLLRRSTTELQIPQRPKWVTEGRLKQLREVATGLMSKESLTKVAFGVLSNLVDGGTLFLDNSDCTSCSLVTSWLKQINLQVFKKAEYHALLCSMDRMSLGEVHRALSADFHWDMAIRELISTRNYTTYELNKSLTEFLELVKLQMLEEARSERATLGDCLLPNVTRNEFGNATLFVSVLYRVARLLRAQTPHLHQIDGITSFPYLVQLETQVAPNLDVYTKLEPYLGGRGYALMRKVVDEELAKEIVDGHVNLRLIGTNVSSMEEVLKLSKSKWDAVCTRNDCEAILTVISNNVDRDLVTRDLPTLQKQQFWSFSFISNILDHIGSLLRHLPPLLEVVGGRWVEGEGDTDLAQVIDLVLTVLGDTAADVVHSIHGIVEELHPLLKRSDLERDLRALANGLQVLAHFKNYLVQNADLKVDISRVFPDADAIELGLNRLGINDTNFWSVGAPRVRAGHMHLKPILTAQPSHISKFVCDPEQMSLVMFPGDIDDVVTSLDVMAVTAEQFCGGDGEGVAGVVGGALNYSALVDKIASTLLPTLYAASNLTLDQGSSVLEGYPAILSLLPTVRGAGGAVSQEPLVQSFSDSPSGGLFTSPSFVAHATSLVCGSPIETDAGRALKAVAASRDFTAAPDTEQMDALPTEFCRSLYKQIIKLEGGKIMWSFVKPLIAGKILYTPPTAGVDRIMRQANASFAHMIKLANIVHSFADSMSSVDALSQHREGVVALRRIMSSPALRGVREMFGGSGGEGGVYSNLDLDGVFDDFGDMKGISNLLRTGSDLLRCVNLNRLQSTPDEYHLTHEAVKLSRVNEFTAGIVFLNSESLESNPSKVEYKIRVDIENTPTTTRKKNYLWIPGPESSFVENMRYFRGFVQLQDMVDSAIVRLSRSNTSRAKRETRTEDQWAVYTQQEPYPCYRKDYFQTSLYESQALIVAFFFSLLFTVSSAVRFIVAEKESGNTMLMSVMGVNLSYHTLSWFISSLVEMLATISCAVCVLHWGGVTPRSDVTLLWALVALFGLAVLAACYMVSKLFSNASSGAVVAGVLYLVTFMPFVIILSLEAVISYTVKIIVCLSMSSAFCYTFLHVERLEATGSGAQWASMWDSEDGGLSIGVGGLMMLFDAALYLAIGLLLDRFFGPKTLQSNITNCSTHGEKAGVSIVNVSHTYKGRRPKMALDNVSIELQKGQITTLLGHNGAGKTTLIKILTGMLKPSKGHVIIRSDNVTGARLGVCPQHDILYPKLTAREHVYLYASLKCGLTGGQLEEEVDSVLNVLSLGGQSSVSVCSLSGGTRRRVCVALAFVSRPHLVFLDEPTAGVDPAARSDIWSMIMKLREDRTILMTTHHLDEAELLSDQIVIVHKGQVHTIGSPIEIKRSLGNGYKLSVVYPDKNGQQWTDEDSMEERAKKLVTCVRGSVRNAQLSDLCGSQVEVMLPNYDADGVHNDFLRVCESLESNQSSLGFASYSLDCTSLEQIFVNICQEQPTQHHILEPNPEAPSKSASTSSIKSDMSPLVSADGPYKGSSWSQFRALLAARYLNYKRDTWLLFLLIVLPALFVATAMAFSMIRPPPDNEISLRLQPELYDHTTDYIVSRPSIQSDISPTFAERVMRSLVSEKEARNWTTQDSPTCKCTKTKQECQQNNNLTRPELMVFDDTRTLNQWIVASHEAYIEKRYGGYSSSVANNETALVAWYNNKGHHALPSYVNSLYNAALRVSCDDVTAGITVYSHPLKISKEQISKDTVYQHVADAGISALVLVAYCLVSGGAAVYLVRGRTSQQKRLQLLCGVSAGLYWAAALAADMIVIVINMLISALVFEAFGFPVFVARNNLPAICLLILLFGYACGSFVHVAEKMFTDASLANMVLFCGNAFVGLLGITVLLILDIISESDATDNARWVLHKVFLLCPQFVLGDGLLEVAKNTIQAQVLDRFGMDTYKDPLTSDLLMSHYWALALVGTALLLLNLAIEYDYFEKILVRFSSESIPPRKPGELEDLEVTAERHRVREQLETARDRMRLPTIGNINAGYMDTEIAKNSIKRVSSAPAPLDSAHCYGLGKAYGARVAVRDLTLGIPPAQCTALLGQNGAGKSTTFSMLSGEVRPTAGQVCLGGAPAAQRDICRGLISYCPQSDAIDPLMTVREMLQFYCRLRGITEQDEVIKRTLDMFELVKYSEVRSGTLSGGNRRKLCTAIALMGRTPLVLLDEPTSGMDPVSRQCVSRGVLSARAGARGVLLSTHALRDARRMAGRVALLRGGELGALGGITDCLQRFGGGYLVACRSRGAASSVWRAVLRAAPHAVLRVLHPHSVLFILPTYGTVGGKEVRTGVSDIFRLMAQLQGACDIEDFTVNQSDLDQMFLSFSSRGEEYDPTVLEPLPTPTLHRSTEDLNSITSL